MGICCACVAGLLLLRNLMNAVLVKNVANRKYSSRIRTTRLLAVSHNIPCIWGGGEHSPGVRTQLPTVNRQTHVKTVEDPGGAEGAIPPAL